MGPRQPSDSLRQARRALEGIVGYRLLDDLAWQDDARRWFLRCRLTVDTAGNLLPPATDWCVVFEDRDPGGNVSIFPAVRGGTEQTFPHQLHNGPPEDSRPWRTGKICTTTPESVLGRLTQREEPLGLEPRLVWHVQRALWWIKFAAEETLAVDGDPFELPDFPTLDSLRFVFSEDRTSYQLFLDGGCRSGTAPLRRLPLPSGDTLVVDQFQRDNGKSLRTTAWGTTVQNAALLPGDTAKWILIDSVPLAGPWQVPVTFEELRRAMDGQGYSLDDIVSSLPGHLRDGRPHLLLIGFPIPEVLGGEPVQIHWQALLLPVLERRAPSGFRMNSVGWKVADRRTLASVNSLAWVQSENWSPANSHARGQFAPELANKRTLIVGAGSLGSAVAEVLVRGGLRDLVVCDGDMLEHGNLARHTLGIQNVGEWKAIALAARLQSVSVNLRVAAIPSKFPRLTQEQKDLVSSCDLIVDCTAEESTLCAIEDYPWPENAYAVSMAFGWFVHRLYVIGAPCEEFIQERIGALLRPFEEEDLESLPSSQDMVREGPGCWHPVFPGRSDDVWMMASAGTKELERLVTQPATGLRGSVLKWANEDSFEGLGRQEIA